LERIPPFLSKFFDIYATPPAMSMFFDTAEFSHTGVTSEQTRRLFARIAEKTLFRQ
jgi:hypothetical protein